MTEEREYQEALRDDHRAIGIPWPVKQMVVVLPSETMTPPRAPPRAPPRIQRGLDAPVDVGEAQTAPQRLSWWRRWFGFE